MGKSINENTNFILMNLSRSRTIMKKYVIVNKEWNSIACKVKNGGRHYRRPIDDIGKGLVVVETTKGRAERERDYLNANYNKGWEIKEVQDGEDKG